MNKIDNIENSGNFKGSLQSSTENIMKRARKYAMSLGFVAAILTVLFSGADVAQAQTDNCIYRSNVEATCPIDNDSGYYYEKINGRWQPISYYKGASTNTLYVYLYAQRLWGALDKNSPVVYIRTNSGWMDILEYEKAVEARSGVRSSRPFLLELFLATRNNLPGRARQRVF